MTADLLDTIIEHPGLIVLVVALLDYAVLCVVMAVEKAVNWIGKVKHE